MKIGLHFLAVVALFFIWNYFWSIPGWLPIRDLKIKAPWFNRTLSINSTSAAFLLSILFAIHPACSECVDYISATTSLQCAVFYVWSYWIYLQYRETHQKKFLLGALFLYFCSVASKEEGITLPAVVFVTEFYLQKEAFQGKLKKAVHFTLPFLCLGVGLAAWIYWMHPPEGNESRGTVSSFEYFMTQWRAYLWYMRLWVWPWDLNADNASLTFSKALSEPLVIQSLIGNAVLLLFGWLVRKRYPSFLFGLLWFYITISPASSIVVLAEAINEHRMYLAYFGFIGGVFSLFLAIVEGSIANEYRGRVFGWVYFLICVGLFVGTQERNRVWANDENLWKDTVEKNPTSGRALNNLALVYLSRGQLSQAIEYLKKCEIYWSTYSYCPLNLGIAYLAQGSVELSAGNQILAEEHFKGAERALNRSYTLSPKNVHIHFHLGRYFDEIRQDCPTALPYYAKALELTGNRYPMADIRMAHCYKNLNRIEDARSALNRALSLEPLNETAWFEKALIEKEAQNDDISIEYLEKVIQLNPNSALAYFEKGVIQLKRLDFAKAKETFEKVLFLDSTSKLAWFNLSLAAEGLQDGKTALRAIRHLIQIDPKHPDFTRRLIEVEKKFGKVRHDSF
jgi:tetratricopeptide (TPR) repeat protein